MILEEYKTIIFDCDGVLLNSNKIKSNAFFKTAFPYGKANAQKLVDYHINNGGVSRYRKFEYFLEQIVKVSKSELDLNNLLTIYAEHVLKGLLSCDIAECLFELKEKTKGSKWLVVSGSDQEELKKVFLKPKIAKLFNGGIYGSPENKVNIFKREIKKNNILFPAVYIGDSKYDYVSANSTKLDFIFVYGWTEYSNWRIFFKNKNVLCKKKLKDLII